MAGGRACGYATIRFEHVAAHRSKPLCRKVSEPVLETIVLATCLIKSPLICKEVHLQVAPDHGASLQLPYYCARHGQIEIQKWISGNPDWRVEKWSCPPNGRVGHKA